MEELKQKRKEVLEAIKPICDVFGIKDYDYVVKEKGKRQRETLRINETHIGCSCNSTSAIVDELIGYIFIKRWCRNRSLGAFSTQAKNKITEFWL